MSDNSNQATLDALLESSVDDLADLPEFITLPNGVHNVRISFESKTVNKHPCAELKMVVIETVELANPAEDAIPAPGAEASVLYMLDNEFGQGKFKTIISQLAKNLGTSSIKETMEAAKGMEVGVTTKVRKSKDGATSYTDVAKIHL